MGIIKTSKTQTNAGLLLVFSTELQPIVDKREDISPTPPRAVW